MQANKEKILSFLKDKRQDISKSAKRVLYNEIYDNDADAVYAIFKKAEYVHVKVNSCTLLCSISKWCALPYIIEFCADENESVSAIGRFSLEGWESRFNQSFTTPSKNQVEKIRKSLASFGKSIK